MNQTQKVLEVNDLRVHYPVKGPLFSKKQSLKAVDGVSFSINKGEIVGLVGESGCGKSTLGRAIVRLVEPISGSIKLNGEDILSLKGKALRNKRGKFQMIFQDPYGSLNPRLSIFSCLDEVLKIHTKLNKEQRHNKAIELLEQVGLSSDALTRYPHEFSGGQRQRIGIARALATNPDLIIADEPVSALDVSVQASIINLLANISKNLGTAILFIAHDLAVVEHISNRIMVMYLGKVVESAPSHQLVSNPKHPYTKALLSAVPSLSPNKTERIILPGDVPSPIAPPPGCAFEPRCVYATKECACTIPTLTSVNQDPNHQCACIKCNK
jgi:oligopeptide/dipeptide ABC transporter ATP-binding protein